MNRQRFGLSLLLVIVLLMPGLSQAQPAAPQLAPQPPAAGSTMLLIENAGQWPPSTRSGQAARFQVWGGPAGTMWLAEDGIWVSRQVDKGQVDKEEGCEGDLVSLSTCLPSPRHGVNIKLSFPGANPHSAMEPFERRETKVSYFLGSDPAGWRPDVPVWGGVRYVDLWPGVDLVVGAEAGTPWRFEARAGADLGVVKVKVEGADAVEVEGGVLRLSTGVGEIGLPLMAARFDYLVNDVVVNSQTTKMAQRADGAEWTGTEVALPLDDPSDLLFSTLLGGSADEKGTAVAIDQSGSIYITGYTYSGNFPACSDAFDFTSNGLCGRWSSSDSFVVKLREDGASLVYAMFLGGRNDEFGFDIALDAAGSAFVDGCTRSTDFPVTPGAFDTTYHGGCDAFVVKLTPEGTGFLYSTYLGGPSEDYALGLAVDSAGTASVVGGTESSDFPTTANALDASHNGYEDLFLARLSMTGSNLIYATFLGGSSSDYGVGITVDETGIVYVVGSTESDNFPTSPGAFDTSYNGDDDVFLAKLRISDNNLIYLTFLGGSSGEYGSDITSDSSGNLYVTGVTESLDFPTIPGAFDRSQNGSADGFVAKLNPTGDTLIYSTYLGGGLFDQGCGIAIDKAHNAYIAGFTESIEFPTTAGAFDRSHNGHPDAFVTKLDALGRRLRYSTFIGGHWSDFAGQQYANHHPIVVDQDDNVYIVGTTSSGDFPTTAGAFDRSHNGEEDIFVVRLSTSIPRDIVAFAANQSPILDGDLSDWVNTGAVVLDANTAANVTGITPANSADSTLTLRSLWTPSELYFAVQVTDETICTDSGAFWDDDEIEIGIDGLHDYRGHGADDHQYTLNPDGRQTDRGAATHDFQAVTQIVSGGWLAEIAVPAADLQAGTLAAGRLMGFNLGIHDDDDGGGYDTHLLWHGYTTLAVEPDWAVLVLSAESAPSPTDTATPSGTPTPTPTRTPTATPTITPSPTSSSTATSTPTQTPSATPSATPTATPSDTPSPTSTPSSTFTPTPTGTPPAVPVWLPLVQR